MRVFISMTISMVVGFWVSAFKAATTFVHSLGDAIQHRLYNSPAKAVEPSKGIETSAAKVDSPTERGSRDRDLSSESRPPAPRRRKLEHPLDQDLDPALERDQPLKRGILESGRSVVDSGVDLVSGILRAPVKILRRARNRHT
ncbi:uncharacterized protein [Dermacentor albipictus]|uniref:uncharacterized protein n=1 Tax=Dermacentor albipictus TaxID=60249 RepID=UPI0031FD6B8C